METSKPATLKGTETVLLAEDDPAVLKLLQTILEEHNYTVIAAHDGKIAIDKFLAHQDKIQVAILDLIMPQNSGMIAYEVIKRIRPDIKALFISGYLDDIHDAEEMAARGLTFISKPIIPTEFLKKLRKVIET